MKPIPKNRFDSTAIFDPETDMIQLPVPKKVQDQLKNIPLYSKIIKKEESYILVHVLVTMEDYVNFLNKCAK